jgi:pimeloyl-ACP methyl ester carboxylesterase
MVHYAVSTLKPLVSLEDVTLTNGVRLHCATQGPRQGTAMLMLHGYSDSSFSFSQVMPLLPADFRVIAPDLRGHGNSERPPSGYHISDMADDVLDLMNTMDVASAIIVGHSMGSFVAQAIAERAPERASALVLTGSAPTSVNDAVTALREMIDALTDPVDEEFVRSFQYGTVAMPVPKAFMDAVIANSKRMPARIWKAIYEALLEYRPSQMRPFVRTLVLGGKEDAIFSAAEQMQLARQYPDARLQLVDRVGHALHWEQPDTFVAALMRFVR